MQTALTFFMSTMLLWGPVTVTSAVAQTSTEAAEAAHAAHKKLFAETYKFANEIAQARTADTTVTINSARPYLTGTGNKRPEGQNAALEDLVCSADLVVVGTVQSASADLTDDEQLVFTDSNVLVTEVLKNNPVAPLVQRAEIIVTRPGGTVTAYGHRLTVNMGNFKPLRVGGTYVWFLRYLPATKSYLA